MKDIFDWLRKRINEKKGTEFYGVKYINASTIKRLITEAEAKWKEDYCVVNHFNGNRIVVEVHGNQFYRRCVDEWKFCPYCGKRIKISEVE